MKLKTRPVVSPEGHPLVEFVLGKQTALLTPLQAEDIGLALLRAATATRYESGMAEAIKVDGSPKLAAHIVDQTRKKIEAHKIKNS